MPHIEFITADEVVAKHFAVEPIKKNIPDWYKAVPRIFAPETVEEFSKSGSPSHRTIKACQPVLDYLTSGYLIKTTAHTKFRNTSDGVIYMTSDTNSVATHGHQQCPIAIGGRKHTYIKFNSPWIITTPKGYSSLFYQPFFALESRFTVFPAIVDTDMYRKTINFPGHVNGSEEVEVEPGTPLMCVFPFKRENWTSSVRYDEAPFVERSLFDKYLYEAYKRFFWKQKSYR